jgi:hypothetical protein
MKWRGPRTPLARMELRGQPISSAAGSADSSATAADSTIAA